MTRMTRLSLASTLPCAALVLAAATALQPAAAAECAGVAPTAGVTCSVVVLPFSPASVPAQTRTRRYMVMRPTEDSAVYKRRSLVLLHATATDIETIAEIAQAGQLAKTRKVTVMMPEALGFPRQFDVDPTRPNGVDNHDVEFIKKMIDDTVALHQLDASRIYAAGYSNGGFMAQRLACELPATIAGIGVVGGALRHGLASNCPMQPQIPVVFAHGVQDRTVNFNGLKSTYRSVPDSAEFWAKQNGCYAPSMNVVACTAATPDGTPARDGRPAIPGDVCATSIQAFDWVCAVGEKPVRLYRVNGGGHSWPGSPVELPGKTSPDLDATIAIWDFLSPPAP